VLLLLRHGADINALDEDGESPAAGTTAPALKRLLLYGAAFEEEYLMLKQEELNLANAAKYKSNMAPQNHLPRVPMATGSSPSPQKPPQPKELKSVRFAETILQPCGPDVASAVDVGSLLMAAKENDLDGMEQLIDLCGVDAEDARTGRTALHWAAEMSSEEAIDLLLLRKADPNKPDNSSATALHKAAWNDNVRAVMTLLQHKADINMRDEDGESPADGAASPALKEMFENEKTRLLLLNGGGLFRSQFSPARPHHSFPALGMTQSSAWGIHRHRRPGEPPTAKWGETALGSASPGLHGMSEFDLEEAGRQMFYQDVGNRRSSSEEQHSISERLRASELAARMDQRHCFRSDVADAWHSEDVTIRRWMEAEPRTKRALPLPSRLTQQDKDAYRDRQRLQMMEERRAELKQQQAKGLIRAEELTKESVRPYSWMYLKNLLAKRLIDEVEDLTEDQIQSFLGQTALVSEDNSILQDEMKRLRHEMSEIKGHYLTRETAKTDLDTKMHAGGARRLQQAVASQIRKEVTLAVQIWRQANQVFRRVDMERVARITANEIAHRRMESIRMLRDLGGGLLRIKLELWNERVDESVQVWRQANQQFRRLDMETVGRMTATEMARRRIVVMRMLRDVGGGLLRMRLGLWCERADEAKAAEGGLVLIKCMPLRWDIDVVSDAR